LNHHEKVKLLMKFVENLRWWVNWLGQLTENDPQGMISKLSLLWVTVHLLHHNLCLFLQTYYWKDTSLVEHSANVPIQWWELFIHAFTYKHLKNWSWESAAQLHLWSTVYQRWRCY